MHTLCALSSFNAACIFLKRVLGFEMRQYSQTYVEIQKGNSMPKVLEPDQHYAGRRLDATVLNTTLDSEAVAILHKYCPKGRHGTGAFLSRLIYEHEARQEAKRELKAELAGVLS
jgi:hypothetical protein